MSSVLHCNDCSCVVPARSSLHCEFVCLPTYESPDSALFRLVILGPGAEGGVASSDTPGRVGTDNLLTLKAEVCTYVRVCQQRGQSKAMANKSTAPRTTLELLPWMGCMCSLHIIYRSLWILHGNNCGYIKRAHLYIIII